MIIAVVNAILAIAYRSLKKSGLQLVIIHLQLLPCKGNFVHESAREFLMVVKRKTNTRETTYSSRIPFGIPEGIEVKFARRHSTANL